jgi:hypothetical protein
MHCQFDMKPGEADLSDFKTDLSFICIFITKKTVTAKIMFSI